MKPLSTAEQNLKDVIFRLGELADKLTFVGGGTADLYIPQPQVVSIRASVFSWRPDSGRHAG